MSSSRWASSRDSIPAFGIERSFANNSNSDSNYPSFIARTSVYYPIEPASIQEAQARVDAIKATEAYKRLELDQHLLEEFRKINAENRKLLEELLESEKAKLLHPVDDVVDPPTDKTASKEGLKPTRQSPTPAVTSSIKPADSWLDLLPEFSEDGNEDLSPPPYPLIDQDDFMPRAPQNSPEESTYSPGGCGAELIEEKRLEKLVADVAQPKPLVFLPKSVYDPTAPLKPKHKRSGSPRPEMDKGKAKSHVQNTPNQLIEDYPIFQSPESFPEGFDSHFENNSSNVTETSTYSNTTHTSSEESHTETSKTSNLTSQKPNTNITSPSETTPDFSETLNPLHTTQKYHNRRTLPSLHLPTRVHRPLRHKPSQQNLHKPASQSPSGHYRPVPFPPHSTSDPYIAWPGRPGQFKHRDPHAEDADLGPKVPTRRQRGRARANAVSTISGPVVNLDVDLDVDLGRARLGRRWSFVRGKEDVI